MAEDRVTVAREDQGRSWGPVYEGPGELVTGRDCAHNKGKTTKGFKQRTRDKTYIYIYVKKKKYWAIEWRKDLKGQRSC